MDYHAIHGHDIASFDTSNTHRLPTISASQVFDDLRDDPSSRISTGIEELDQALLNSLSVDSQDSDKKNGGLKRGQVAEIWGPPGSGKTALGIQLTAIALRSGDAVVWVDCFQTVCSQRITSVIKATKAKLGRTTPETAEDSDESRFFHYNCLTLPHFMALISRPTANSIANNSSLIIVDSLSALINSALPRGHDGKAAFKGQKGLSSSAKRLQAVQSIINALQKLAATRNCAVVILSQCATKMHAERGATLTPSINAAVWEQGVTTRIVFFRDWIWQERNLVTVLVAGLQRLDGKATHDAVENVVAFKVETDGIVKVSYDVTQSSIEISNLPHHKRKLGQTELEVPDSEDDEDYGWAEEDEAALPAPPPQWQGSEDLLLGQDVGRSEDDSDGNSNGNDNGDYEIEKDEDDGESLRG